MTKKNLCICGACGRMGRTILSLLSDDSLLSPNLLIEAKGHPCLGLEMLPGIVVRDTFPGRETQIDVSIDFSVPDASMQNLAFAADRAFPMVIGTTGFSSDQKEIAARYAEKIPLLMAPNMSLGVNCMMEILEYATALLPGYEVEIVETHHHKKEDAPSGTALKLGEIVCQARDLSPKEVFTFGRSGRPGPRSKDEIGIHAIRLGEVVGEHQVFFAGPGEVLELSHRCFTRESFAAGAILAAKFLLTQDPGLYSMKDVIAWMRRVSETP